MCCEDLTFLQSQVFSLILSVCGKDGDKLRLRTYRSWPVNSGEITSLMIQCSVKNLGFRISRFVNFVSSLIGFVLYEMI